MKTFTRILMLFIFSVGAHLTTAQPPPDEPVPRGGPPPHAARRGEGPDRISPMQRWMNDLRRNDPEAFDYLQKLRMENPEAFRAEARSALAERALNNIKRERPGVHQAILELSQEDRDWIVNRIARMPPFQPTDHFGRSDDERPTRRGRSELQGLIRQYYQSNDEAEQAQIRSALRDQLSQEYDRRVSEREEQMRDAERKLEQVRRALEQGMEDKDRFIDEKISVWLDQDSPPRRGDRPRFRQDRDGLD